MNYVSDSSVVSGEPSLFMDTVHSSFYKKQETKENLVAELRKQSLLIMDNNETRL